VWYGFRTTAGGEASQDRKIALPTKESVNCRDESVIKTLDKATKLF
jgi:hypothetical protein